jgi:hypothetical protein
MVDEKIITPKTYMMRVEDMVAVNNDVSYRDACIEICEGIDYPIEDINKLITPILLEKLRIEASSMNLLIQKETTAILPI